MAGITDRARPYQTPDLEPVSTSNRLFNIPDDSAIHRAWIDQLSILTDPASWDESDGGLSAIDTASLISEALQWGICSPIGGDDMAVIIPHSQLAVDSSFIELSWSTVYDVLELTALLRSDLASGRDKLSIEINGDAINSNYRWMMSGVSYSGISTGDLDQSTVLPLDFVSGEQMPAGYYGTFYMRFIRGENWQMYGLATRNTNTTQGANLLVSGIWESAADIQSLRLDPVSGDNFVTGCAVMLRGI